MQPRKIKLADACDITGYSRDELNYVLRNIPACTLALGGFKASREFTPIDLLALSVVFTLDRTYGLRLKAIAQIFDQLRQVLAQPRSINEEARLVISIDPPSIIYLDDSGKGETGIIVGMKPIFSRIDHFCHAFRIKGQPFQANLALGPGAVATSRVRSAS